MKVYRKMSDERLSSWIFIALFSSLKHAINDALNISSRLSILICWFHFRCQILYDIHVIYYVDSA